MARIRRLIISNFRSIQALDWVPAPGINCLIGPGDSGKSSILDAIDLCVGARRGGTFGDMDFFALNVDVPITISVTTVSLLLVTACKRKRPDLQSIRFSTGINCD